MSGERFAFKYDQKDVIIKCMWFSTLLKTVLLHLIHRIVNIWLMKLIWLGENRPLCVTSPLFQPPFPSLLPLEWALFSAPPPYPMQNEWHRCCWTRQYPLVPFPSLFAQHEVWNLFFDHCPPTTTHHPPPHPNFSLLGRKRGPKEEGNWELRSSQIKEGGKRGTQPWLRNMKKTYCSTICI